MTRAEASRINGAKSKGPKTEEGKKRSSRNALKHGLASPFILLPQEAPEHFHRLCDEYVRHFQPQNEVERDLVYEAVSCMWRIIRIQSAESSLIEIEISRQRQEVDQKFNNPDDWVRLAMAFENLANNGRALALMSRYESRLMRAKDRAMEQLRKLRADPQPEEPQDDEPDENLPSESSMAAAVTVRNENCTEPEAAESANVSLIETPTENTSTPAEEPESAPEPAIEKMPNKPTAPAENSAEPAQNQSETCAGYAPEPAQIEPEKQPLDATRDGRIMPPNPPGPPDSPVDPRRNVSDDECPQSIPPELPGNAGPHTSKGAQT